jgi:transposase-like protein
MKTAEIPTSVDDLRARWGTLHDLDRAEAVKRMSEAGKSIRSLAKELGRSASLLRYLLIAANAPSSDRVQARRGEISTRELVRRSRAAEKLEAEKARLGEERRRAKESKKWSTLICAWLNEQELAWAHQENIIEETKRELMEADLSGTLPNIDVPAGVTVEMIIDRARPSKSGWDQALEMEFYICWLAHWTLYAIPDAIVRDNALSEAFKTVQYSGYEFTS